MTKKFLVSLKREWQKSNVYFKREILAPLRMQKFRRSVVCGSVVCNPFHKIQRNVPLKVQNRRVNKDKHWKTSGRSIRVEIYLFRTELYLA